MKTNGCVIAMSSLDDSALAFASNLSSWFANRGRPSAVVCAIAETNSRGRDLSKLLAHIEDVQEQAIKGYFKTAGEVYISNASLEILNLKNISKLCDVFVPLFVVISPRDVVGKIEGISMMPLAYVLSSSELDAAYRIRCSDEMICAHQGSFRSMGFCAPLCPVERSAAIARCLGVPYWGNVENVEKIAQKIMDMSLTFEASPEENENIFAIEYPSQKNETAEEISDGLGPISKFLRDEDVSEIMINDFDKIYVERKGRISRVEEKFKSEDHLMRVVDRMVLAVGRRIDESSPMVDARLPDGSRVNAVLPPLSTRSPVVTIRKFLKRITSFESVVESQMLDEKLAELIRQLVRARASIVISGGTGSGKTTLLNVIASAINKDERIITVEDSAELKLAVDHVVGLEARQKNVEGAGEVTIRDLVRNALRMRPDRIIVGECRGAETLDMLQAMNTGHEGSLTTVHANSPRDALSRLETMVMYAGEELPLFAIREQVARAIKIIIQVARFADGVRKVTEVCEVTGIEGQVITMQTLAKYDATKRQMNLSGVVPEALQA